MGDRENSLIGISFFKLSVQLDMFWHLMTIKHPIIVDLGFGFPRVKLILEPNLIRFF